MPLSDKRPDRNPSEIIHSINKKAANVKEAADALTQRIALFEHYLSNLRGRMETTCYGNHPDWTHPTLISLALSLQKRGKTWVLLWATYDDEQEMRDPEYSPDFNPLVEAPLKIKVAALKLFPNLLEQIEKSQEKIVDEVTSAAKNFDAFMQSLEPPYTTEDARRRLAELNAAKKGGK